MRKVKIGLALGAGAAIRMDAHWRDQRAERAGIAIDVVAGCFATRGGSVIPNDAVEHCNIPFGVVATNLSTGRELRLTGATCIWLEWGGSCDFTHRRASQLPGAMVDYVHFYSGAGESS